MNQQQRQPDQRRQPHTNSDREPDVHQLGRFWSVIVGRITGPFVYPPVWRRTG
jgi:hypothetical protein